MFMKKIAAFIVVAGLLVGGEVMADWSGPYATIKNVYFGNGFCEVTLDTTVLDPATCRGENASATGTVGIDTTSPNLKEMYATIMMAFVSQKKVRFWIRTNMCSGQGQQEPYASSIQVNR